MKLDSNLKIFVVEIIKVKNGKEIKYNSEEYYVIAKHYTEAAEKALEYVENDIEKISIIDEEGSLSLNVEPNELRVKKVELATDKIIA